MSFSQRGADAAGPRRYQRWLSSFLPEELDALLTPEVRAAAGGDPLTGVDERALATAAHDPWDVIMDSYCRFYMPGDINVKVEPGVDRGGVGGAGAVPGHGGGGLRLRTAARADA